MFERNAATRIALAKQMISCYCFLQGFVFERVSVKTGFLGELIMLGNMVARSRWGWGRKEWRPDVHSLEFTGHLIQRLHRALESAVHIQGSTSPSFVHHFINARNID